MKMDEFVESVKKAHEYALKEGIKAAKSGTVSECAYYRGCIEAYEYVLKELNRLLGIKVKKWLT